MSMEFIPNRMIASGGFNSFRFEKISGLFNGWDIDLYSNLNLESDLANSKYNADFMKGVTALVDDFSMIKKSLENHYEANYKICVHTPDGVDIGGNAETVNKMLKQLYGRGLWDKESEVTTKCNQKPKKRLK